MSFRENILKKIEADRLARQVVASLVPKGDVRKIDREGMRGLLEMAGYRKITARDLELYLPAKGADAGLVLVLDNGLALYRTSVEDVALRKSPTVKEMVSIRNVIRILKDDDVVVSKKEETVERVRQDCVEALDLRFTREDLDGIRLDGAASLESAYPEGVVEAIEIFAEILNYRPPPKVFATRHAKVAGRVSEGPGAGLRFGPVVIFSRIRTTLGLIESPIDANDKDAVAHYHRVADGAEKPPLEGMAVFAFLMEAALASARP